MRSEILLRFQNLWRENPIFDVPRHKKIDVSIAIPFGSLTLSPQSPTAVVFSNARVPLSKTLILTSFSPVFSVPFIPPKLSIGLSTAAPIITIFLTISPPSANLVLSSVASTANPTFITPPSQNLVLSLFGPIDEVSNARLPLTKNILLSSIAPTVTIVFTSVISNVIAGALIVHTYVPTVVTTTVGLIAPVITTVRRASAQSPNIFWNLTNGAHTGSNELTVVGTSNYVGATVSVFLGGVLQGITTTDSSGNWKFSLPAVADGGPYSLTASLTSSPLSNTFAFSIDASISLFTNVPDNTFQINSFIWNVESAAVTYNVTNPDTHTLRFEVHSGDRYSTDYTTIDRTEIHNSFNYGQADPLYVTYQLMHETGAVNGPGERLTHLEMRNVDNDLPVGIDHFTNKVIEFSILAEKLSLGIRYCPTNLDPNTQATSITPWTSATNIVRDQWYKVEFYIKTVNDSTGFCQLWIDGVQVLNYSGSIGFGPYHNFWRLGLIRNTQSNIQSIRIKNFSALSFTLNAAVTPANATAGTSRNITVTPSGGGNVGAISYATPVSAGLTFTPVPGQPGQWTFVL